MTIYIYNFRDHKPKEGNAALRMLYDTVSETQRCNACMCMLTAFQVLSNCLRLHQQLLSLTQRRIGRR